MRVVAALGGNALLARRERPDAEVQERHVQAAVAALSPLAREHELVVTHGNGPQVGLVALESAADPALSQPYPFDVLGAQTKGMIGYWLLQALQNALPGRQVAAIISQTLVSAADPAFGDPTKSVGPVYAEDDARRLAAERGWTVRRDGTAWQRVVPSPAPQRVVETSLIHLLLAAGAVVVCAGGGVPVIRDQDGALRGVEAVVDKDLTAALLAEGLDADALLLLTDVPAVQRNFGAADAEPIGHTTRPSCGACAFRPGRWDPRCRPCAGSSSAPAAWLRSAHSTTPRRSWPARPAPSSPPVGDQPRHATPSTGDP